MPSPERRKKIENMVDKLIEDNGLNVPGFDLSKFLTEKEHFKIALLRMDGKNSTGMLLVDDDNTIARTGTHKLIVVNSLLQKDDNFKERKRFITAHEYGHFILHKKDHRQFASRDKKMINSPEEKEADFFARCLLMPKKLIESSLQIGSIDNMSLNDKIMYIARLFNVTEKKARQRLVDDLGYAK